MNKILYKSKKAFTLVELIIVITILAILFTIAYVSFKNYVKDARDGTRVTSIGNIQSGLEIENTVTGKYPDPDKKDGQALLQTGALSISGSIVEYSYLGVVGDSLTKQLSLSKIPTDPLTGDKYIYTKTIDGKKYQVASILENPTGYKNNLVKQVNAGNEGYVAKVEGNHKDIVIKKVGTGSYITVVPSLVFDGIGSNILNQTGTLLIVNNKSNLPYSADKNTSLSNTKTAEQLMKEIRNNNLATIATLKLPDGVTLDGSGVLNQWWVPNQGNTNWNGYSSGVILASLGAVSVDGGADYTKLTAILNGWSVPETTATTQVTTSVSSYDVGNSLRFNGSSSYLSRTPGIVGNKKVWTFSGWFKFVNWSNRTVLFNSKMDGTTNYTELMVKSSGDASPYTLEFRNIEGTSTITSSMILRDPSSWYHIVASVDTNQSVPSDRVKLYVNGQKITSFVGTPTYPGQYVDTYVNDLYEHRIMRENVAYSQGYTSNIDFVDSGALTPTSFGQFDTNGRWVPKSYTGSYGTNGFHLDFSSGATTSTGIGKDSALIDGTHTQANNWTPNNINTYDQMIDSPTNNFATLNPLITTRNNGLSTLSLGNLKALGGTNGSAIYDSRSTRTLFNNTKQYIEVKIDSISSGGPAGKALDIFIGENDASQWGGTEASPRRSWGIYNSAAGTRVDKIDPSGTYTIGSYGGITAGDYILFAYDSTNYNLWMGYAIGGGSINWVGGGDPSSGTLPTWTLPSDVSDLFLSVNLGGGPTTQASVTANFGQGGQSGLTYYSDAGGSFKYAPPTGFKALSTKNITYPIEKPKDYFDVLTWTGDGNSTRTITGLTFTPDLVWLKDRTTGVTHTIYDILRGFGALKALSSASTGAEGTIAASNEGYLSNVTLNNLILAKGTDTNSYTNKLSDNYVAWNWKKSSTSGFDIVQYNGNGTSQNISHGLGKTPSFTITKDLDGGNNWVIYHNSIGISKYLLFTTDYAANDSGVGGYVWNGNSPTTTQFSVSNANGVNQSGHRYISYLWSEVPGYSKFGSYTGNGSATGDGPFVYTGFKPRYIMIKRTDASGYGWEIHDTARSQYNTVGERLFANDYSIEAGIGSGRFDILSNGFKLRTNDANWNASSPATYIYAAFAELPFK